MRSVITSVDGRMRLNGPGGLGLRAVHLRFCRSQYHHMNHASRAQTSQEARNITVVP
jgi:hypothetical protein